MTTLRTPFKKTALAIAAMLVVGVAPMEQAVGASCTWNPAAGNWNNPAAWSCGVVPGSADSATIGVARTVTINDPRAINTLVNAGSVNIDASVFTLQGGGSTTNTGTINVGSAVTAALQVQGGHNIDNTGGVINIANGSVVNQFGSTIAGGTINSSGTGALVAFSSGSNFLNNVTLNGRLDLASNGGIERVSGGMVLNGTVEIGANAVFATQGNQTISGSGSIVFTDNNGSNRFNLEAGDLVIGSGITVRGNTGTFGGQSFIGGAATLTNNGTIKADVAGGTITLFANGGVTNNGVLSAQNGGTLLLNSNLLGNVGSQLLAGAGSSVVQNGITISGVVTAVGTGNFQASSSGNNFLNGVTLNGRLDLASNGGIERVSGGMVLNGTVEIGANAVFATQGNQTISGSGSIVFTDNNGSNRFNLEAGDLVIGSGITVRGNTGTFGGQSFIGGAATLTNNGTIKADVAGGTITLFANGGVTNNGVLSAQNGGTLLLNSNLLGNVGSQLLAGAGSSVVQNGITISGVVTAVGTGNFQASSSGNNFLNGVTLNGRLDLASNGGIERVTNGLTLNNATIDIGANSIFAPQGDQTIGGTGSIVFADNNGSNRFTVEAGVLTIGPNVTVRGNTGTIGGQVFVGGAASLINNGTISADVAAGTITLGVSGGITNNGTLSALNGGTLLLNNNVANTAGAQILAGAGSTVIQNGVTLTGTLNVAGAGTFRASASGSNFFDGVAFSGALDLAGAPGIERVTNGLTLNNATINIGANSILAPQGNQTIGGTGSIVFADNNGSNLFTVEAGVLTIGPNVTVRGNTGTIGGQVFVGGAATLTNNGTINSDGGGAITIGIAGALTNNG